MGLIKLANEQMDGMDKQHIEEIYGKMTKKLLGDQLRVVNLIETHFRELTCKIYNVCF